MTTQIARQPRLMTQVPPHSRQRAFAAEHSRGPIVVLAATIAMVLGFGGLGLITVIMAPMEADLLWSRADTSLGYAFSTAGIAVGGVIWGRLSDRLDLRRLQLIGASGMVGSLAMMSMLHSLWLFYLANLIYGGLGFAVLYAPLLSTSGEWFPQRRGLVIGLVTAGGALGQGLLPYLANEVIAVLGWRWGFASVAGLLCVVFSLTLPLVRWPQGTKAPAAAIASDPTGTAKVSSTIASLALAAFLCCLCMAVAVVHMATFIGSLCGSPSTGVSSLVIAMIAGAFGRVSCGMIADRIGPLRAYATASAIQTVCVLAFPALEDGISLMALSALFGFGFAGNMTCLALCVRRAVPANKFGAAIGLVMMLAWFGMAAGGYMGGVLFDLTQSYALSFLLAGMAGVLNLAVLGWLAIRKSLA